MKKLFLIMLTVLGLNACANAQSENYSNMDVEKFSKYLTKDNVQLIDVRTPEEFAEGHIAGAKNINVFDNDFIDQCEKTLDKTKPVAVYCRSGKRSAEAAQKLSEKGYDVTNLLGGIIAWKDENEPVSTDNND